MLHLAATWSRRLNWSLFQAGAPSFQRLVLHNRSDAPASSLHLRIQLCDILDSGPISLPRILPGAAIEIKTSEIVWIRRDLTAALKQSEARTASWHLQVADSAVHLPVELLAPDEWCAGVAFDPVFGFSLDATLELLEAECDLPPGGVPATQQLDRPSAWSLPFAAGTASLVLPRAPAVVGLKQHALRLLDAITGRRQTPLVDWVSGDSKQKAAVVQAVYAALVERFSLATHDIEKLGLHARSQRVRLPDEIAQDAAGRHSATCIDYVLLFCALLEACGLEPLLVMIGCGEGGCHAMAGCWLDRPVDSTLLWTNADRVRKEAGKGHLLVVDVAEFAHGRAFSEATALGAERLRPPNPFCYVLDIAIARRPPYTIAPLPFSASWRASPPAKQASADDLGHRLRLDRPAADILADLERSLASCLREGMFQTGGICQGCPLRPLPDAYYVAGEASRDEDLRSALTHALGALGVRPVGPDDHFWQGYGLCKRAALIRGTPFGVYQLTSTQDRNVCLELGMAIGIGRPFLLLHQRSEEPRRRGTTNGSDETLRATNGANETRSDADLPSLLEGLDHFSLDSYLELRYGLGAKVRDFLVAVASAPAPPLPPSGVRNTVVVAHGGLDVLDFAVAVGRVVADCKLTPVFLDDPTGKLGDYLTAEKIPFQIVGTGGQGLLHETLAAIQAARFGIYRAEQQASANTFLALGMSLGSNRQGMLVHQERGAIPEDLKGLSTVDFRWYNALERILPEHCAALLRRRG